MTSLITVAALTVMPLHTFGHSETMPIKACGSALADYVASVCDGVYKSYKRTEIRRKCFSNIFLYEIYDIGSQLF